MTIELLDLNKQWGKIKAGMKSGNMWKMPARASNPTKYVNGRDPLTEQAQLTTGMKITSAFTGKTFSQRNK